MASDPRAYRRILLKLSGEALVGPGGFGLHAEATAHFASEIASIYGKGLQICLVVGAGNIFRGDSKGARWIDRTSADYMGMLATVMNALAVRSALEAKGVPTRVQSAIPMPTVCESFARPRAERHLKKGRVVIFAGGTGSPYFSTDTAAALRAAEMGCDALLKGTQVDGVYSADPKKDTAASRYGRLTFNEVLARNLKVMDATAIALARENKVPILVFSIHNPGALAKIISGEGDFTLVDIGP